MSSPTTESIAVVISTRNRPDKIAGLLPCIRAFRREELQIVIVDQSLDDQTETIVKNFLDDARIRYFHTSSLGVSNGRNFGVAETDASIICITDDDCLPPPEWPERMASAFAIPDVGLAWCSVVPLEDGGFTPKRIFSASSTITHVQQAWHRAESGFNLGAGLAVRRSAFKQVGGFDAYLGPGAAFPSAEDNDLAWRVLLAGWSVRELADVTVVHDGKRDFAEFKDLARRDCHGIGGACAKYLRTRRLGVVRLVFSMTVRSAVTDPLRDMLARRRPRGFRRALWIWQGLVQSRHYKIDAATLRYQPQASAVSENPIRDHSPGEAG